MTTLTGQIALVTGANRGVGAAFVAELLDRGAAKVYAAARNPESVTVQDERVVPLRLDVTDPDSIAAAAAAAQDVTVLVNNAAIDTMQSLFTGDLDEIHREFETNVWGPILVIRAFAPILERNGGGAIVNMHSVASWLGFRSYGVTKAALWSVSNSARVELAAQNTQVVGVHVGYIDTDMAAAVAGPKTSPAQVAIEALDAVAAGEAEAVIGEFTQHVKASLSEDVRALYPELA